MKKYGCEPVRPGLTRYNTHVQYRNVNNDIIFPAIEHANAVAPDSFPTQLADAIASVWSPLRPQRRRYGDGWHRCFGIVRDD